MSLKSAVLQLLIYKENSTNCYFSIYLLGWETLVKIITDEDLDKNPTERDHDEGDATYVLNGKKISIKRDFYTAWGEVDGDKLTLQYVDDGEIITMIFTKR